MKMTPDLMNNYVKQPLAMNELYKDSDDVKSVLRWFERTICAKKNTFLSQPYKVNARFETAVQNLAKYAEKRYKEYIDESWEKKCLLNATLANYAVVSDCCELVKKDSLDTLIMAAGIFVLDYCGSRPDKTAQIVDILQEGEALYSDIEDTASLPPIQTTSFDSRHVQTMYRIIKYREKTALGKNKEERKRQNGELLNTMTAQGIRSENPERKLFDRVIALIDDETLELIMEDISESLDVIMDELIFPLREFDEEFLKVYADLEDAVDDQNTEMKRVVDEKMNKLGLNAPTASYNPLLVNQPKIPYVKTGKDQNTVFEIIHQVQQGASKMTGNPMNPLMAAMGSIGMVESKMRKAIQIRDKLKEMYLERARRIEDLNIINNLQCYPETKKKLITTEISHEDMIFQNPYAIAFGLLYAVESGNDCVWLGGITNQFCYLINNQVPWGKGVSDYYVNEMCEKTDDEKTEKGEENEETTEGEESIYSKEMNLFNFDSDTDNVIRYTIPQAVFEDTAHMLPRNIKDGAYLCKKYKSLGFTDREAALMASVVQIYRDTDYTRELMASGMMYEDDKEDNDQENVEEINRRLQEKLRTIKKYCDSLEERTHSAEHTLRKRQEEIEQLKREKELDRAELADLRELLFNQQSGQEEEEESEEENNKFPYNVKKQTIVFGGHKTWLKAIRPMLEGNIRFYEDRNSLNFDQKIINNAEAIWIQINAISHSAYYRIVDQARLYNKPVHYFSKASALSGAIQVMEQDMIA